MGRWIPRLIGFFLVLLACSSFFTPIPSVQRLMKRLEYLGYDMQLRASAISLDTSKTMSPVVIVDIDDKSLSAEGHWPWPRSLLATLLNEVKANGASVVAFDIFFSEPSENIDLNLMKKLKSAKVLSHTLQAELTKYIDLFNDDVVFSKSIASIPTVLPFVFLKSSQAANQLFSPLMVANQNNHMLDWIPEEAGYVSDIPVLAQAATAGGFINIYPEEDGIVRRAPLLMMYQNHLYPSLALQTVLLYLNQKATLIGRPYGESERLEGVQIGTYTIPTDAAGMAYIPFVGKSYSFPYYSATDVLHHRIPKNVFANTIVLIGTSAIGLGDFQPTAIESPFPGVEIQASLMNGMLLQNFSYGPAWIVGAEIACTFIFGLLAAFIFPSYGPKLLSILMLGIPAGTLYANYILWQRTGLVLSLLVPAGLIFLLALFNVFYGYLFETRKREKLKAIFGQYVPQKHINEMLKSKETFSLRGENREMSVLFTDIRHFTTLAEGMKAEEVVALLNAYFTPMTEVIYKYQGTVDKYIGDLIMAFWGAPLSDKLHAKHALSAALDMQAILKKMNIERRQTNSPRIAMGVGINTGMMNVGDMGSKFRRNYTVLGDAVNLASRLESLTKFYGVRILVSESTIQHQTDFVFRKIDCVRVKGKKTGLNIYELVGRTTTVSEETKAEITRYHQALNAYNNRAFESAQAIFSDLVKKHPKKRLYRLYLKRCLAYQTSPPPTDWDGVYVHHHK